MNYWKCLLLRIFSGVVNIIFRKKLIDMGIDFDCFGEISKDGRVIQEQLFNDVKMTE